MLINIASSLKSVPKSFYYLSSRVLLGIGQLIFIKVLTSVLVPREIGKYYLLMSIVSLVSLFIINPVLMYVSRHFYSWVQNGMGWFALKRLIAFVVVVSAIVGFVLLAGNAANIVDRQLSFQGMYLLIPLLVVGSTGAGYVNELLNIIGKSQAFIFLTNFELWGKILAILLLSLICPPGVLTIVSAITVWSLLVLVISGRVLLKSMAPQPFNPVKGLIKFKEIYNFAWPFSIATGFYWCQSDGYRFILQHVSGMEALGRFVVSYNLGATLMIALDVLFHQLYMPIYYREISTETHESYTDAWNKYAKTLVGVFVPCCLFITFAGPNLARCLLHSNYWDVGEYAAFGAIAQLLRIFSSAMNNGIIAIKHTSSLIFPSAIGAIVVIIGTYLGRNSYPMIWAGSSIIFSYAIVSTLMYLNLSKKLYINFPIIELVKSIAMTSPVCVVLILSANLGFHKINSLNILTLIIVGTLLVGIQYILSKDIWFAK